MSQTGTTPVQDPQRAPGPQRPRAFVVRHWFALCALLVFMGYVALFLLLQSTILWQIYSPVQDRFPQLFGWLDTLFPGPPMSTYASTDWGLLGLALYILVLVFLFAVYLFALRKATGLALSAWASGRLFRRLMWITACFLALLMVTREIYAVDVFAYSWFGRIAAVFNDNPYIHVPSEYAAIDTGAWLPYLYWHDLPSPYGPVWLIFAGGVAKVANLFGSDIAYHVLGHKLLVSVAYLLAVWLTWKVAGQLAGKWVRLPAFVGRARPALQGSRARAALAARKARALQFAAALAFAWNPLMLIEFGISAHNDLLMLVFVLLALYLHLHARWQLAVLALALAFLIKFTALIFLPGYLWLLLWQARRDSPGGTWARGVARVAGGVGVFAATCVAFYIPFWQGPTTLNVLYRDPTAQFFVHSFGTIANRKLPDLLSAMGFAADGLHSRERLEMMSSALARWVPLVITALVALWKTWPARSLQRMLQAWGWTVFVLLSMGLAWFWPWYVAWLLVPALLSSDRRLINATLLLSFTSLTIYLVGVPLRTPWPDVRLWTALWVMGPPLLYVGYTHLRARVASGTPVRRPVTPVERAASHTAEGPSSS